MAKNLTISADGKTLSGSALKALSINGTDLKTLSIDGVEVWRKERRIITNGITELPYTINLCYTDNTRYGEVKQESGYIKLTTGSWGDWGTGYGFSYSIDLTDYSTLSIDLSRKGDGYNRPLLLISSGTGNIETSYIINKTTKGTYNRTTISIDISSITGNKYVTVYAGGNGITANAEENIYNLWLE